MLNNLTLDNIVSIVSIIVTAIVTYIVTRYSSNRPNKISIKEKQFRQVYLPLYKIFCLNSSNDLSHQLIIELSTKLHTITLENVELVFPHLYMLSDQFRSSAIQNKPDSIILLGKIRYQIYKEYALLRRNLGYPSQNPLSILKRLTVKDKIHYLSIKLASLYFIVLGMTIGGGSVLIIFAPENISLRFMKYLEPTYIMPIVFICLGISVVLGAIIAFTSDKYNYVRSILDWL